MSPKKKTHTVKGDLIRLGHLFNDFNETAMRLLDALDVEGKASGYCNNPKILRIQQTVADHYNMPISVMTSKLRPSNFVEPRHVAIALSIELTRFSTTIIGINFNRDRTAILYAVESVQERRKTEPSFANQYESIRLIAEAKVNAALPAPVQTAPILPLQFQS